MKIKRALVSTAPKADRSQQPAKCPITGRRRRDSASSCSRQFCADWAAGQPIRARGAGQNVRRRGFGSTGCEWKLNSGVSSITADVWLPLALVQQKAQTGKRKDFRDSENLYVYITMETVSSGKKNIYIYKILKKT